MNSFSFVSGRLSLDFVGTLMWRNSEREEELLGSHVDMASWTVAAGVLDEPPTIGTREFGRAIALREAIYDLVAVRRRASAQSAKRVLAATAGPIPVLSLDDAGRARRTGPLDTVLTVLARDAIELVGGDEISRIRQCDGPECTRLFVDTSRGRPRRWCGMSICGNREKAANYRRRKRGRRSPDAGRISG